MLLDRRFREYFDFRVLGLTVLIPLLGLVVLYSAGYEEGTQFSVAWLPIQIKSLAFVKQSIFLLVGFLLLFCLLWVPSLWYYRGAYIIYGVGTALLVAVLLIGVTMNGSQRWLSLGIFNFQPSEIVKVGMILGMARYLSTHPPSSGGYSLKELFVPAILITVPMLLILRQPDLGTALVTGTIGGAMVLFMGVRVRSLVLLLVCSLGLLLPAWQYALKPYQKRRIESLFNPDADPLGSGYHIIQSKIAVGSGSLVGKGFLEGTQTQLEFLPEHTTDFVFSVLAEEWGFLGSVLVLLTYLVFVVSMLLMAGSSNDVFSALVIFGVAFLIFIHVIVNVGMVIGLLPVVGLPLLLFSYGGTSVLMTLFLVGIALGLGMQRVSFQVR